MTSNYDRRMLTKMITNPDDEIVISGLSGRYPNSANVAEFSYNLYNKVDMVDDDERRWRHTNPEIPKRTGKTVNLEKFDAFFFSVHHRQAQTMDPQCRMLLEHSYEAILDAGVNPKTLRGSRTGVFMGCCFAESEETWFYERMVKDGLGLTGSSRAMLANRVSFALGLQGPSFMVDTACSSSMYALDCGFNAIRNGECDAAIVGGTNLVLHPHVTLQFARLGVLAKDGFTRSFDSEASGYTRSEAVSVVFLQRAKEAKRIYANVLYSKTNNDGFKKEGITYPSGETQMKLLKEFYEDIKIPPSSLDYVEAHSTGTKVGDPEECNTLDEVFCKGRDKPLPVGSVKSNMGHAEATSGVCSITKVILAFESQLIAPNIHFKKARPGIPSLESGRLKVIDEITPLEGPLVGINSFGFGGGNAHALLRAQTKVKVNHGIPNDKLPRLLFWAGRTEEAVNLIIDSITKQPLDAEYVGLLQNSQTQTASGNTYRAYGIFEQPEGDAANAICLNKDVQQFTGVKRPIVWVYSGMGSQWVTMGADLMKIPIFEDAVSKCHDILSVRGLNLKEILTSSDPTTFDNILHSFVGIAAVQIGLTDILKALNLEPDYIIGHSVGELGCAYADGCITAEEMILSAYSRGMASNETKTVFGSMAAVGLGYKKLRTMVPDGVEIACHNGPDSCTISGPAENVAAFVDSLKKQNYFAKEVACSNIPYHSSFIAEMGPKLLQRLNDVLKTPKKRSSKWICSSVPKVRWGALECQYSSALYHTNNLLSPVLFDEASELLPKDALTIEIAPHSLLQAILKKSIAEGLHIGLTQRGNNSNTNFLMTALGKIFQNGIDIDISKLYPPVEFPVSRGTPMVSSLIRWDHTEDHFVTRYEAKALKSEKRFHINISDQEHEFISGHTIDGRILFPATGYLHLVWEAFAEMSRVSLYNIDIEFEDVKFLRATGMTKNTEIEFSVVIQKGTGKFEIVEGTTALVTGVVRAAYNIKLTDFEIEKKENVPILLKRDFYKELRLRGYHYNGLFKSVEEARADGIESKIKWDSNYVAFLDCLLQVQIIKQDCRGLLLPTGIRKILIKPKIHQEFIDALTSENQLLDVYSNSSINILRCGGIEMRGLQASSVSRRRPPGVPVLEAHKFIPHLPTPMLSKIDAARYCVQLVLENTPTGKIVSAEIDSNDGKEPLSEYFGQALGDLPLVTPELNYLTTSESVQLDNVNVQSADLSNFSNNHFVIKSNILADTKFLEAATNQLIENGYIVARESSDFNISSYDLPKSLQLISIITTEGENIALLQYVKTDASVANHIIKITSDNYNWIEDVKQAVKNGPTIAYAEKEEFSGILGFVNCIRKEPNGLNLRCVFVDDKNAPKFDDNDIFYSDQIAKGLAINVFKNGQWGTYKHLIVQPTTELGKRTDHCYANSLTKGDLSSLTWLQGPISFSEPEEGMVKLQYASLNFRDVMLATGKLSSDVFGNNRLNQLCVLGFEYSGVQENGQKVMGMLTSGALGTHVKSDRALTWNCPDDWTLEDAATMPVVYATVYSSFFHTVKIEKGKSILIHAGSGGIGLAAIRVAFAYGLEVFTTVSTEEKKQFLLTEFPQLKAENIGNSRDISFEDMIMLRTNGEGVDYVLNSLADEKLQASIRCLGKGGKFLEIGKFDMANDSKIGLGNFLKELSFHAVLVDNLFHAPDEEKMVIHRKVQADIDSGIIKPLRATVFDAHDIEQAFRYLASGKHVGKVLLKIRENEQDAETLPISVLPRVYCKSDLTYVIPGGLGGFGLELADWLVLRGCRKLVLSSSRGISNSYQSYRIKIWESYGVKVLVNTSKISTKDGCEQLIREAIKLGPVGGIFNLAVILQDSIFENQDESKFIECMAPKAVATKYLDEVSRELCPQLQYFVVFSSVSCGRGNAGQSNYGMANSVMERIMGQRHSLGLPAKAVQWGAVGEVGLVADMAEDKMIDMEIGGTLQQRISSCLEELDTLLTVNEPIVASMVVAEKRFSSGSKGGILDTVMNIMSIRDIKSVSMETTLSELGMDSLMTVEIQQTLEREYELVISTQELRSMTLSQLVQSANKKSTDDQTKAKTINDNIPTGVAMLLRNLGDETHCDETIVHLKGTSVTSTQKALIVPGIEGMAGQAWYSIAENLKYSSSILQLGNTWRSQNLESIYNGVIQDVTNLYKNEDNFLIIGYSFGTMLALEIAKSFELEGKTGKIVLIDGSPQFLNKLAGDHLPVNYTNETIETLVLVNSISLVFPDDSGEIVKAVLSEPAWDSRIQKLLEIARSTKLYSDIYGMKMMNALVNRLKLTINIDLSSFSKLNSTKVTLVRPSEVAVQDIEEDYGLSSYCAQKIDLKFIEGNHATMLENPKLTEIINNISN